jgi:DNA topoisomerase-1
VTDTDTLERIRALAIPPAWSDVWICESERGHIQAVGTDAAGRRQYLYHPDWRMRRDHEKFDRALLLAAALPGARRSVTRDLAARGLTRSRALAAAFRIVDRSSLRIGSEHYLRANGSRGLTTLQCRDVKVDGDEVTLSFPSKSHTRWLSTFEDRQLARFLKQVTALRPPSARVVAWRDSQWHSLTPEQVNNDLKRRTHADLTANDFRTLRGTAAAAVSLARNGPETTGAGRTRAITRAVADAAAVLGNTPAVARSSYIDPRLFDAYRQGQVIGLRNSVELGLPLLLEGGPGGGAVDGTAA